MAETLAELAVKITADTASLQTDLGKAEKSFTGFSEHIKTGLKVIGGAFTAFGVGGLKMVSSSLEMNAALKQVGLTIGATGEEMKDLALSVTDVSSPLSDVIATFELLTQAGIRNTETIKETFTAFDALGDATGSSAEEMANVLIPVFRAFGEELPRTTEELDKFTWLSKNTTVSISDFGIVVQRLAPEMQAAGLSINDAMIAVAALAERGITGRKATQELGEAITKAATDGTSLADALGLTSAEVTTYTGALRFSTGITQEYADAAGTQHSIMDKVKQAFSELTLKASGFLEPLEPILAGMTALGPIMMMLSTNMAQSAIKWGLHTAAMIAHKIALIASTVAIVIATVAQWAWNIAMTANPIGLIIIAIAALIAAIVLIAKNWDEIRKKIVEIWNNITTFLSGVWDNITRVFKTAWEGIVNFFSNIWDRIKGIFQTAWDAIVEFFSPITTLFSGIIDAIKRGINNVFDLMRNFSWTYSGWAIGEIQIIPSFTFAPFTGLPSLAMGGIITQPTMALIGEAGPEAVVPLGAGIGGVTVNFTQPVFFDREDTMNAFVDKIYDKIKRAQRLQFGGALT